MTNQVTDTLTLTLGDSFRREDISTNQKTAVSKISKPRRAYLVIVDGKEVAMYRSESKAVKHAEQVDGYVAQGVRS